MENKTKLTIDDYSKWRSNLEPYPQGENVPSTEELIELHKRLMEDVSKIPTSTFENLDPNSTGFGGKYNMGNNPCEHCPNNPKNNPHSSGFCSCVLPSLMNPMY